MPLEEALRKHPFLEGLPDPLVKKLAAMTRIVDFDEDEIVFRSGERSMHFCLLIDGSVCVELSTPVFGMTVQILSSGDAFGWSAILSEHHTVFQVRAREPSRALCLDGVLLSKACQKDSKLAAEVFRRVAEVVAKRVRATELRLAEFCGSTNHNSDGSDTDV